MYDEHGEPDDTLVSHWNEHNDHAGDGEQGEPDEQGPPEAPEPPAEWNNSEAAAWRSGWEAGWLAGRDANKP